MSITYSNIPLEPDRFTFVPANVKILKVLVEELHSAAGSGQDLDSTAIDALQDDESGDDEEWEDDPDILDFPGVTKKGTLIARNRISIALISATYPLGFMNLALTVWLFSDLLAFGEEGLQPRLRDDETQAYLMNFFREASQKPGFTEMFNALTPEEQVKLHSG
jgi:importin-9